MGTGRPIEQLAQLTLLGSTEQYFNKAFLSSFCIVNELKMICVTVEDGRWGYGSLQRNDRIHAGLDRA